MKRFYDGVMSIMVIIFGIFLICTSLFWFYRGQAIWGSEIHRLSYFSFFISVMWPLFLLIIGVGTVLLRDWARIVLLVFFLAKFTVAAWNLGVEIFWIIKGFRPAFSWLVLDDMVTVCMFTVLIFFLTRPKVKKVFMSRKRKMGPDTSY